jgi:uncharacterized protein
MRRYCKAYHLRDLKPFPGFSNSALLADDDIVYVHQDFTVTESMWHGESVIFHQVTPEWRRFCEETLQFRIPDDLASISGGE